MIDNWTERKEGDVKMIHYPEDKLIELIVLDGNQPPNSIYFDYSQFERLVKLISSVK